MNASLLTSFASNFSSKTAAHLIGFGGSLCLHIFPSLQLPFRVAELEELDEIAVAKFSALEELDDCTDVIVVPRIATEDCSCLCL